MAAISVLNPNVSLDIYQNTQAIGTLVDTTSTATSAIQRRVSLTNYLNNPGGNYDGHLFQTFDGCNESEVIVGHQLEQVSQGYIFILIKLVFCFIKCSLDSLYNFFNYGFSVN